MLRQAQHDYQPELEKGNNRHCFLNITIEFKYKVYQI